MQWAQIPGHREISSAVLVGTATFRGGARPINKLSPFCSLGMTLDKTISCRMLPKRVYRIPISDNRKKVITKKPSKEGLEKNDQDLVSSEKCISIGQWQFWDGVS
jgi:hypothetical protein